MTAKGTTARALVMLALTTACGGSPHPAAPTPAPAPPGPFRVVAPPGGPGASADALPIVAARVLALGDSQLHHMYGKRTFAQSPFADRLSFEVAVRPAALDDGADLLLEAFLAERRRAYPRHTLVFMGDAADLSCAQEYDRFFAVMAAAGEPRFAMLTSNHDGFFAGNFTQQADAGGLLRATDMPDDWTRACAEPGSRADHRLTRAGAVARILPVLPAAPAWATDAATGDPADPSGYAAAHLAFVRPLGGGDAGAPAAWGAYLDTVDYRGFDLPASRGAGTVGSVPREQLAWLDRAMFEARVAAPVDAPPVWLAFGHHTLQQLDARSRARLLAFLDLHPEIVAYVSAHTHISDERVVTLPSGRPLREIVVGSTTDAPQEARLLEVRVARAGGAAGVASWRLALDVDALCAGIRPLEPDSLGYTGYKLVRDDVPDFTPGLVKKLAFYFEVDDLGAERAVQTIGALVVEAYLVRALAHLYLSARDLTGRADAAADTTADTAVGTAAALALLEEIAARRFPDGDSLADLGRAAQAVVDLDDYDLWIDPALARAVPAVARALWRFGAVRELVEQLRRGRGASADRRRFFACHAARAAVAEARLPRRSDVVYIP